MKIKYYPDTDTLYMVLSGGEIHETREINENLYVDLDAAGRVVGMTIEEARAGSDVWKFSYEEDKPAA